jgi:hypothetical protein
MANYNGRPARPLVERKLKIESGALIRVALGRQLHFRRRLSGLGGGKPSCADAKQKRQTSC